MLENRRVYPVMIQPGLHLDDRGGEIAADTANLHGVEHGYAQTEDNISLRPRIVSLLSIQRLCNPVSRPCK